jgi:hypothetical protein
MAAQGETGRGWDAKQVRGFVRDAKREAGDGWSMLGARVQRALIAERAFMVVRGQCRDAIAVDAMDDLLAAMLAEAGLAEVAS